MAQRGTTLILVASCFASACVSDVRHPELRNALVINEVMTDNDAAWVDEAGEVEDWIEIVNVAATPTWLDGYLLRDSRGRSFELPKMELASGDSVVVFADDDAKQGPLHADFKLSAQGVALELVTRTTHEQVDHVDVPALPLNFAYARFPNARGNFAVCRYATPGKANGAQCGPPAPPAPPAGTVFKPYTWNEPFPRSRGPLVLSELALKPARFVEVANISANTVMLEDYSLRIAPTAPGRSWPGNELGAQIDWNGQRELAPGERIALPIEESALAELAADPAFEGVATLFDAEGDAIERVDFMRWPEGAILTRVNDDEQRLRFCRVATEGSANTECDPLPSRDVGDRIRHLYTPGDYAALAEGETNLGFAGVKFVLDMEAGDVVHLLSTRDWALHYTFIRERIDGDAVLDRCDPMQASVFNQGWYEFSQREYFRSQGRRYLLGTLDAYAGGGLKAFDFTYGDQIVGDQMKHAFFAVAAHLDAEDVREWSVHPSEPRQTAELLQINGQLPLASENAPFENLRYQPLTEGVSFGVLEFVPASELEDSALGPDYIVVTDAVPNDIPFVGGLITEAFQTPLAHVNVLSQNRNTPNMALRDARHDASIAPLLGQLVRLEVRSLGFAIRAAAPDEVDAFRNGREPSGPRIAPRIDLSVRGVVDLQGRGLSDLPSIGAKAAQLAELGSVRSTRALCMGPIPVPEKAFAIPLVHYMEHFERSGARALLEQALSDPQFRSDPRVRAERLSELRTLIQKTPVDRELMDAVEAEVEQRFGDERLRFRSSSNTEDLQGFNGAGLYLSLGAGLHDDEDTIEDAIVGVWASLWNARAYDEREFGHIDQLGVAMGVLVHPAFESERANVIAISRDVLDPTRSDIHYMNAQVGEASVANPAPGVATEQLIHRLNPFVGTPEIEYQGLSSLTRGANVLSQNDARNISCWLNVTHDHFRAVLDPKHENSWFAMDVEIKLVGPARSVVIKQARPYAFARADRPSDCREQ